MSNAQECKAVLKNVLYRTDWQYVSLGDLFLEDSVVRFIPYGDFRSSAPIVSGAAAVLGGLVGAISNRLLDGSLGDAVPHAKKARMLEWAMEPARRADRHAGAIEVHRSGLKRLETEGGITFETKSGTELFGFAFDDDATAYATVLKEWYSGSLSSQPSAAQQGIGTGRPAPLDFIESTLAGRPVPDLTSAIVAEFSEDTDYLRHLFDVFGTYGRKKKEQLLNAWQTMPNGFKRRIASFMADKMKGAERAPILSFFVLLMGISGIAYAVHGFLWISSHKYQLKKGSFAASGLKEIGAGLVSVFMVIFAVVAIASWLGRRGYRKMLLSFAGPEGALPLAEPSVVAKPNSSGHVGPSPKALRPGVELGDQAPSRRIIAGQAVAGLITGVVFGSGVGLALHLLASLGSPKPGAEIRGASMALWAFAGAYLSGALLSGLSCWLGAGLRIVSRIGILLGVGAALWGLGAGILSISGLYEFDGGGAGVAGVMGLVLGAPVYLWLHDCAPWMFPFLRDLKEREDRELIKQFKDE